MNLAEIVFKDGNPYDYQPILNSFGEILLQVDDKDYQGDSRILYRGIDKIGYLQFGWGSCSGCDELQACKSVADVQNLIGWLEKEVKWFDSAKEALDWFEKHDWMGDYSYHRTEQSEFVEKSKAILASMC
jgi:hypothetical protein